MSFIRNHAKMLAVATCSVAAGAGGSAIAVADASTHHTAAHGKAARHHILRDLRAGAVQGDAVVHTKSGFKTISFERGTVVSVSGQQLTLTEGTPKATYKTVTETIPSNAVVRDDHAKASLSSLTAGQRVLVVQGPKRTFVRAHTPKAGK